jgi:prenyltransferase beta subunit
MTNEAVMRLTTVAALSALFLAGPTSTRAAAPAREPLDESIDRALTFLASTQGRDGGWSSGNGRFLTKRGTANAALTSLGVMAFLAAGHVPGEGKYGEVVEKGVRCVMDMQQANGLIASPGAGMQEMYHHGISTLLLAEVVGMTDGDLAAEVRRKLERAVALTLRAQRREGYHRGGWRYNVSGSDSDISVTGWQLMSLRAAKNLGCDVPPDAIDAAVEFIKRCHDPATGGYRYMPGAHTTLPCTGTSVLAMELCGKNLHRSPESLRAGSFILKVGIQNRGAHFFYGVYYCAQAMFQLGDNYWKSYRTMLHDHLFRNQNGDGSWSGGGGDDNAAGPNYCTAMAVLALTVEYRFLPIYQRGEENTEPGN